MRVSTSIPYPASTTSVFAAETNEFMHAVEKVMAQVRKGREIAEIEKLRAIGQRNRVENEREDRERKKASLHYHLKDRQMHLDRYQAQYRSLLGVVSAQRVRMDKLQK